MKQSLMVAGSPLDWSLLGLVLFCMIFVGIIFWTYRRGSKKKYEEIAKLALDGEKSND